MASRSPYEQRRLLGPYLIRVIWERPHLVQCTLQDPHGDPEPKELLALWPSQVCQQKLPHAQVLLHPLQDVIRLRLPFNLGFFNVAHRAHVIAEHGRKDGIDRGIVDGDYLGDQGRLAERYGHGGFGAHGMTDQNGIRAELVLLEKRLDIGRHRFVVVALNMGTIAMVPEVKSVDGGVEVTGERSTRQVGLGVAGGRADGRETYLLMPRLFCLEPKRPCITTKGDSWRGLRSPAGGSWRVNAKGTVSTEELYNRRRPGAALEMAGRARRRNDPVGASIAELELESREPYGDELFQRDNRLAFRPSFFRAFSVYVPLRHTP
jgi:hypothetical protein